MNRSRVSNIIIVLCGVLVIFTLLMNLPHANIINQYGGQGIIYIMLTAVMLLFGVLLTQGEFSVVHVAGIAGYLSLPIQALPILLWGTTIGALLGGTLLMFRQQDVGLRRRTTIRYSSPGGTRSIRLITGSS